MEKWGKVGQWGGLMSPGACHLHWEPEMGCSTLQVEGETGSSQLLKLTVAPVHPTTHAHVHTHKDMWATS